MLALLTCGVALAAAGPVAAEKPTSPPGLSKRGGPPGPATPSGPGATIGFAPHDQLTIRQYYGQQFAAGRCPPGLAKKNNGCLPPGQAKKWAQGQPLPAGVPYYALPPELLRQLVPPPVGYQYIRIANDVLLMATGTRMIVDAVRDLALP
ncbi:MAG: hypothetical protein KIT36_21925 [Alphaproteobacteria bacterium]|nr:hypothetical protein [Alphaproteobacteria bacterium]